MKGFMHFVHRLHKYKKNEHFVHNTIYKQSGINIILIRKLTLTLTRIPKGVKTLVID